jgi:hypothetical protein
MNTEANVADAQTVASGSSAFSQRFMETVAAFLRDFKRSCRSDIARESARERWVKGIAVGGTVPYGFRVTKRRGSRVLVHDRRELRLIRRIYELREQGATLEQIHLALRIAGQRNRSGGEFTVSFIWALDRRFRAMLAKGELPADYLPRPSPILPKAIAGARRPGLNLGRERPL